jgi:hypothetical protein
MLCFLLMQYIVIPTRRSMAEAVQILLSHALGDAGSPYLVGLVCSCFCFSVTECHIYNTWIFSLVITST